MRKILLLAAVLAAAAAVYSFAWPAQAQGVRRVQTPLLLEGPGSSIGVSIADPPADTAGKGDDEGGVRITAVAEDSPAARAGLRAEDVVVEFDGERIRSARQFARIVRETRPDRPVRMAYLRGGSRNTAEITPVRRALGELGDLGARISRQVEQGLRALPRDFNFDFDFDGPGDRLRVVRGGRLGASLTPLTPQLAQYFGVSDGLLVASVDTDSSAAKAGLKAGDVITAVGGRDVRSAAEVTRELRRAEPGTNLEMRVTRDRQPVTVTIPAPERPAQRPLRRGARI
jgi:serine protease Do